MYRQMTIWVYEGMVPKQVFYADFWEFGIQAQMVSYDVGLCVGGAEEVKRTIWRGEEGGGEVG